MSSGISLNTFVQIGSLHKRIMLSCGFPHVILHVLICSEGQFWFGIEVEPKEGDDHDFVEYQSAYDQEYEATELEPVEILLFAIDFENEEEDPDHKGTSSIYGRSLC